MSLKKSIAKMFGYDAVKNDKRRKTPTSINYSEDNTLPAFERKKLTATTRDVQRNFSVASWGIRKHLDYVSTFTFQSKTGDEAFDRRLEELMQWWSEPQNCDIRGKHNLQRFIRIAEQSRTIDGDVFIARLRSGHLQAIESDRVADPTRGTIPQSIDKDNMVQGVILNDQGRATSYVINKRAPRISGSLTFEKVMSARNVWHLGYFDRFDQVRGVSRLASAINTYQDLYEGMTYAIAKAKISQLFGLVTYRNADAALTDLDSYVDDNNDTKYDINFGVGPFHLDLEDNDKAEILESKTPSMELQQFTQIVIAMALKSLDIPYSFYAENFTNYSGSRQALLQYEQSARSKRAETIAMLNWITKWKVITWVSSGTLQLPAGKTVNDIMWEWIPMGLPWIDPLKEVKANVEAINAGIMSRQIVCRTNGLDWFDVQKQLDQENKIMAAGTPAPNMEPVQWPEDDEDEEKEDGM